MFDSKKNLSARILLRLAILGMIGVALLVINRDYLTELYLGNQLTSLGLVINGTILGLFLLGLGKIVFTLFTYLREERALATFSQRLESDHKNPDTGIDPKRLILRRYRSILLLSKQHAPINHGVLASTLIADESTRISFPKFINNILILTGVFGTIVSLSIALIGASDLLKDTANAGNMGLVIHGMSTALSTTITAIVCYLFYGYFYLKLTDAQTFLISGIEQVTSHYLLPRYAVSPENIAHEVTGLVRSLKQVAEVLHSTQQAQQEASERLIGVLQGVSGNGGLDNEIGEIKLLLREGFRLPVAEKGNAS